jgi:protein-disulfide isomerase
VAKLIVPVNEGDHIRGDANAPMTLVEYGDYECPHCAAAHPVGRLVQAHYGRSLRFVFRHFPLGEIHPHAEVAAQAAEFAGAQDLFWEMHDRLFENSDQLELPILFAITDSLGLSEAALRIALVDETFAPKVRADFIGGARSGVNGTPTFFIGDRRHDGEFDFASLCAAIDAQFNLTD